MKFLVDKSLSPRTVDFLKEKGYSAVRVDDVLVGKPIEDKKIFNCAIEHKYYIITTDLDFGEILAYTKSHRPSTIILRLEDQRVDNVNRALANTLPGIQKNLQEGSIIIIEEKKVRIRELPL